MLVTLPEETPVNEVVETAFLSRTEPACSWPRWWSTRLSRRSTWPDPGQAARRVPSATADEVDALSAAADFRRRRQDAAEHQLGRLAELLPLPQIHLPYLFTTEIGPDRDRRTPGHGIWPTSRGRCRDGRRRRPWPQLAAQSTASSCAPDREGWERPRRRRPSPSRRRARGRRACVVTIDPANRLADALGLAELTNDPPPGRRDRGPASCGR